jgi:hypothetical protein
MKTSPSSWLDKAGSQTLKVYPPNKQKSALAMKPCPILEAGVNLGLDQSDGYNSLRIQTYLGHFNNNLCTPSEF